jgi:tRNA-Thr(GGU) m(6)t(6)A37 methyltransferase TsaA
MPLPPRASACCWLVLGSVGRAWLGKSNIAVGENANGGPILTEKGKLTFIGRVRRVDGLVTNIEVFPEVCEGLRNITEYSHLIVLYWAHRRDNAEERRTLLVCPKRHGRKVETGVFSCRSPSRPNPICLCVVELLKAEGCDLTVKGLDAELGSPIVDIKPYVPHSDSVPDARVADWVMKGPPT